MKRSWGVVLGLVALAGGACDDASSSGPGGVGLGGASGAAGAGGRPPNGGSAGMVEAGAGGSGGAPAGAGAGGSPAGSGGTAGTAGMGGGSAGSAGSGGQVELGPPIVVAAGFRYTCAHFQGDAYCWGDVETGSNVAFGAVTSVTGYVPSRVKRADGGDLVGVRQLAADFNHQCALLEDSSVTCWGRNYEGQLGHETNLSTTELTAPLPVVMAGGEPLRGARHVAIGQDHSCAALGDGRVLCWGYNRFGQLGHEVSNSISADPRPTPVQDENGGDLFGSTELASGALYTCSLANDRRVLCWGWNVRGELGRFENAGTIKPNPAPWPVIASEGEGWLEGAQALSTGNSQTCVLIDGKAFCWGSNQYGQLGNPTNLGQTTPNVKPLPVKGADGEDLSGIRQLATGFGHSCALLETGRVLCWGLNIEGQAGEGPALGTFEPNATPAPILDPAGNELTAVTWLALGAYHSCALFEDGRLVCWGSNGAGELGNETNYNSQQHNPRALPVQGWPPAPSPPAAL